MVAVIILIHDYKLYHYYGLSWSTYTYPSGKVNVTVTKEALFHPDSGGGRMGGIITQQG